MASMAWVSRVLPITPSVVEIAGAPATTVTSSADGGDLEREVDDDPLVEAEFEAFTLTIVANPASSAVTL